MIIFLVFKRPPLNFSYLKFKILSPPMSGLCLRKVSYYSSWRLKKGRVLSELFVSLPMKLISRTERVQSHRGLCTIFHNSNSFMPLPLCQLWYKVNNYFVEFVVFINHLQCFIEKYQHTYSIFSIFHLCLWWFFGTSFLLLYLLLIGIKPSQRGSSKTPLKINIFRAPSPSWFTEKKLTSGT